MEKQNATFNGLWRGERSKLRYEEEKKMGPLEMAERVCRAVGL